MHSLDEMIQQHMLNPMHDALKTQGSESAILHLRHDFNALSRGLEPALECFYAFNAAAIVLMEQSATNIVRDPMGLKGRFKSKEDAVLSGLSLLMLSGQQNLKTFISIGWGWTVSLPNQDFIGIESYRAKRLADFGATKDISITKAMFTGLKPIDGVGVFEAKTQASNRIGFPYWIVRDYR